jgi:TonB family protein
LQVSPDAASVDDPNFAVIARGKLAYAGCSLDVTLRFFRDLLDEAAVQTTAGDACHMQIERDLVARHNDPYVPLPCPNVINREWKSVGATATYTYYCIRAEGQLSMQFRETTDASGRSADAKRTANCQRITVEVLPGATSGASDPTLAPDVPKLGCTGDYPAIALRLQEQGAVELSLRIPADGSVQDVELVQTSNHPRLDNAAMTIAQQKLHFVPATRDGTAVESSPRIRVIFKVLHYPSGIADMAWHCSDGTTIVSSFPCYGPFPALEAVPAKGGAKLRLRANGIVEGARLATDFTNAGRNASPALGWDEGPRGTKSYVVMAEDPAQMGVVNPSPFWVLYDIPAASRGLPAGIPRDFKVPNPAGAINSIGYGVYVYRAPWIPEGLIRPVHFVVGHQCQRNGFGSVGGPQCDGRPCARLGRVRRDDSPRRAALIPYGFRGMTAN